MTLGPASEWPATRDRPRAGRSPWWALPRGLLAAAVLGGLGWCLADGTACWVLAGIGVAVGATYGVLSFVSNRRFQQSRELAKHPWVAYDAILTHASVKPVLGNMQADFLDAEGTSRTFYFHGPADQPDAEQTIWICGDPARDRSVILSLEGGSDTLHAIASTTFPSARLPEPMPQGAEPLLDHPLPITDGPAIEHPLTRTARMPVDRSIPALTQTTWWLILGVIVVTRQAIVWHIVGVVPLGLAVWHAVRYVRVTGRSILLQLLRTHPWVARPAEVLPPPTGRGQTSVLIPDDAGQQQTYRVLPPDEGYHTGRQNLWVAGTPGDPQIGVSLRHGDCVARAWLLPAPLAERLTRRGGRG